MEHSPKFPFTELLQKTFRIFRQYEIAGVKGIPGISESYIQAMLSKKDHWTPDEDKKIKELAHGITILAQKLPVPIRRGIPTEQDLLLAAHQQPRRPSKYYRLSLMERDATKGGIPCELQFDHHVGEIQNRIESGNWWKLYHDNTSPDHNYSRLTALIGVYQRQKQDGEGVCRSVEIFGEWHKLLESTHQVFLSANRRFPEISWAFDSLIDSLAIIDRLESEYEGARKLFFRHDWITRIGTRVNQRIIYLLLLYFTYLRIECPNAERTTRSNSLIAKNHLFCLLDGYPPGINDCFFQFLGDDLFCRPGELFRNRYWQEYNIAEDDSLKSIIETNYIDGTSDFMACLTGLRKHYLFLSDVSPTARLLPIAKAAGIARIMIVPPSKQNNVYQSEVDEVEEWQRARNLL